MTGGDTSVAVFPLKLVSKQGNKVAMQGLVPMMSLVAEFEPFAEGEYKGYHVEVTTQSESNNKKSQKLTCVMADFGI